jgi:hypothetical protein
VFPKPKIAKKKPYHFFTIAFHLVVTKPLSYDVTPKE